MYYKFNHGAIVKLDDVNLNEIWNILKDKLKYLFVVFKSP